MEYFPLFLAILATYLILAFADYYTTLAVLKSGRGKEANPLMAPLVEAGEPALWAQLASGALSAILYAFGPEQALVGMTLVVFLKAIVVLNNSINAYLVVSKSKR